MWFSCDINVVISTFACQIIAHSLKTTCADADIKSIKSGDGVEKLRMLHFLAIKTFDSVKDDEPKELCAIIERPKAAALEPISSFAQIEMFNQLHHC